MRSLLVLATVVPGLCALAACGTQTRMPTCLGLDLTGAAVAPLQSDAEVTVLCFVSCDCPISNRYAPTLRQLAAAFTGKPVRFWLVYPDPDTTAEQIEQHLAEYRLSMPALQDPRHALVEAAHATTVPEVAVFVRAQGQTLLAYHGSIDDRFVDFGIARPQATRHHLRDVLDATLAGRRDVFPSLPAIGCPIPGVRGA